MRSYGTMSQARAIGATTMVRATAAGRHSGMRSVRQCPRARLPSSSPSGLRRVAAPRIGYTGRCTERLAVHASDDDGEREDAAGRNAESEGAEFDRRNAGAGSPSAPSAPSAPSSSPSSFSSILGIVNQKKQLSLNQRYRALVLTVQAYARTSPFLQQLGAQVGRLLEPLRERKAAMDASFASFMESYEQYLAMETKARWSWEKRHRKEMALLASIPPYIGMCVATVLYEVFVPCSVGVAVLGPLYVSWVLYDRWWLSPVVLGMALVGRWKFCALRGWCLVWPGVM